MADPSNWPNRLMIAIPCGELGYQRFWLKNLTTVKHIGWHLEQGRFIGDHNAYIHINHNRLVRAALERSDWDRLLWLEHDHEFPADTLEKHASYEAPVVAGIYVQRLLAEPLPVLYNWDATRENAVRPSSAQMSRMLEEPGLHRVDVVPMGCTSIRRDVLENWPNELPRFFSAINPHTEAPMSDDVWFCRQAQDQGHEIYVDTSLQVGHYVLHSIGVDYFVAKYNHDHQGGKHAKRRVRANTA